jgi:hypothetical protein|tara:strand:- start:54 stop:1226 length:1173 start_codon:yes stop_codon:yes gene_type:complete
MHHPTTVLNQLLALLPENSFQTFVGQHEADKYVKRFSCWNQLTVMLYAQSTKKDSLRDIELGLRVLDSTWTDLGLKSAARSTLAYANKTRPSEIYESLFYELLGKCKELNPNPRFTFKNPLRAVDSTTIDLCLSLFDWAKFRTTKGAIKLHTSFDIRSQIPDVIEVSDGKTHDVQALKRMNLSRFPRGTIFIFDKAYIDYELLWKIVQAGHHFVTRLKKHANIVRLGAHRNPVGTGIMKDERIAFVLPKAQEKYPTDLRLVTYIDAETKQIYEFFTDEFRLSALNVAGIYKARWEIELFFKWIKQNLKIKTFFGTSENAVKTQIWIAMIYYLLLQWLSACINAGRSITDLTRMIATVILHTMPLLDILCCTPRTLERMKKIRDGPQMSFF